MTRETTIRTLIQDGSTIQRTINELAASVAAAETAQDEEEARLTVWLLTAEGSPVTGKNEAARKAQSTVWLAEDEAAADWRLLREAVTDTRARIAEAKAGLTETERLLKLEMELLRNETARLGDPFAWAATVEPAPQPAQPDPERYPLLDGGGEGLPF